MVIKLKQRIPNWPIAVLVAGILVLAVVLFTSSPAPATPTITWTPSEVVETVAQGGEKTVEVSFTSEDDLTDVAVFIVSELETYVSADPSSFASISAGTPTTITLTLSAGVDAPLETFEGTLQLKDNSGKSQKTYAQPLPITLTITDLTTDWLTFTNEDFGYEVKYPPGFDIGELVSPARTFERPSLISSVSVDDPAQIPGKFTIELFANSQQLSLSDWIETARQGFYRDDAVISDVTICGVPGKQYASFKGAELGVYFEKDDTIYALEWHRYSEEDSEGLFQFNSLVSSFSCL